MNDNLSIQQREAEAAAYATAEICLMHEAGFPVSELSRIIMSIHAAIEEDEALES